MTLLDANVLLYAHHADCPQHAKTTAWLKALLESNEIIAIPWLTIWAFLRISTNIRVYPKPMSGAEAFHGVRALLTLPGVVVINPGPSHAETLEQLVNSYGVVGPLMTDAVLAAMAVEHGAALASTDRDFSRFDNIRWINPLD